MHCHFSRWLHADLVRHNGAPYRPPQQLSPPQAGMSLRLLSFARSNLVCGPQKPFERAVMTLVADVRAKYNAASTSVAQTLHGDTHAREVKRQRTGSMCDGEANASASAVDPDAAAEAGGAGAASAPAPDPSPVVAAAGSAKAQSLELAASLEQSAPADSVLNRSLYKRAQAAGKDSTAGPRKQGRRSRSRDVPK